MVDTRLSSVPSFRGWAFEHVMDLTQDNVIISRTQATIQLELRGRMGATDYSGIVQDL
jgi:hypothetical protein